MEAIENTQKSTIMGLRAQSFAGTRYLGNHEPEQSYAFFSQSGPNECDVEEARLLRLDLREISEELKSTEFVSVSESAKDKCYDLAQFAIGVLSEIGGGRVYVEKNDALELVVDRPGAVKRIVLEFLDNGEKVKTYRLGVSPPIGVSPLPTHLFFWGDELEWLRRAN